MNLKFLCLRTLICCHDFVEMVHAGMLSFPAFVNIYSKVLCQRTECSDLKVSLKYPFLKHFQNVSALPVDNCQVSTPSQRASSNKLQLYWKNIERHSYQFTNVSINLLEAKKPPLPEQHPIQKGESAALSVLSLLFLEGVRSVKIISSSEV